MKTLVAVPVFNEERTVKGVLEQIWKFTSDDILVVNDGSTDDSLGRIMESNVAYVISHERNMGPGAALISSFKFAIDNDYDVLVTLDADGQHDARHIPELLSVIGGADMVVGSRYLFDSFRKNKPPAGREQALHVLNSLVRKYTGYDITDCASGFRAYKVSSLRKIRITEKGYAWPFQLWIQAYRAGFKVKEVPISLIYIDYKRDSHGEFRSMKEAVDKAKKTMEKENRSIKLEANKVSEVSVTWTRYNVGEIIPDVITPLSWSILDPIANKAYFHLQRRLGISGGHVRFLERFYGRGYINRSALESISDKFATLVPTVVLKICWIACVLPLQIRHSLFIVPREVGRLKGLNMKSLSSEEISNRVNNLLSLMQNCFTIHIACTIMGDVYASFLRKMIEKWGGKYSAMPYSVFLTGLSGMKSAEPGINLWKLSREASSNEKIRECVINCESSKIFSALEASNDGKKFAYKIREFLNRYGYFSLQEFELSYPRWEDDPIFVLKILKSYVVFGNSINPLLFENRQRVKRLRATRQFRKELVQSKYAFPHRRIVFDAALSEVQNCTVWRENTKQNAVLICNRLRRCYLELAHRFFHLGFLEEEADIHFLTTEEIRRISIGKVETQKMKELISLRKLERKNNLELPFPSVIEARAGSEGEVGETYEEKGLAQDFALKGVGCSIGRITGKARVILDPAECDKLQGGEILVAPLTNPGWTPLFVTAKALITEVGGVSSHGAVVAREYGIPCVVNVRNATKIIKNGATLTVDGEKGIVYLDQVENT